jgi:all-trans-retinol dehydrogenase (NAD+)
MKDIKDKLILITGGAGGIGRLAALDFAGRGGRVLVWDTSREGLNELELEAREKGLFIRPFVCDVSDRAAVYRLAEGIIREWGPVDILINNAGVVSGSTLLETPDEKIIRTMEINVMAHFWTCKAFLPAMLERDQGHLVTISSAAGLIGVKGLADYSASKFAACGLHEALRMELAQRKSRIKTTVVCPFFIDTGMFQGVKTRFPWLLPILKSEYAAHRIVEAVLRDRKQLIMPPAAAAVFFLRLFPVALFDGAANFFGINHSMDDFTGRVSR